MDVLEARAGGSGDARAVSFVVDGADAEVVLNYADLSRRARAIATRLSAVCGRGDRALLLYPPGIEFVAGLFGCFYTGVVAVPAYPPRSAGGGRRLDAIVADAGVSVVLTAKALLPHVERMLSHSLSAPPRMVTDGEVPGAGHDDAWAAPQPDSVALLQYTSGATGAPKGVVLSHENLLRNSECIYRKFECSPDSVAVIWLPPYHDMGLIGGILQPIFGGFPTVLLSPLEVLARPRFWLETISRYRGTISGGPNFAYELCARRVLGDDLAGLDLRSWAVAFNGAEPVRAGTLRRFTERFAPAGFRSTALYPCYGLAEVTLLATGGRRDAEPTVRRVGARELVSCGSPPDLLDLAIVDPGTQRERAEGEIGEIWLRGPSVAMGYWRAPQTTRETFNAVVATDGRGPFLRTGDLGMVIDGELFVTGRDKELIVLGGRNFHPHDIEAAVDRSHPAVRPGCGTALALEADGAERLVIVQEVRAGAVSGGDGAWQEVIAAIRGAVAEELEIQPHRVVLVAKGEVPKTSSGKLRRLECGRLLSSDALEILADSEVDDVEVGDVADPAAVPASSAASQERIPEALDPAGIRSWLAEAVARATGSARPPGDGSRTLVSYGIDSLAAVRIRHACETVLNIRLDLATLLRDDLDTIARELWRRRGGQAEQAMEQAPSTALSAGERALWLLDRIGTAGTAYHLARAFRIHGPVRLPALLRAFERAVAFHPALRTRFVEVDGAPARMVDRAPRGWLSEVDASRWDDGRLREALESAARAPFDLAAGPLFRVRVYRRGDAPPVVLVAAHHLVMDYWSLLLLIERVWADHTAAAPADPAGGYPAFVAEQAALLAGSEGERLARHWLARLDGAPPALDLPTDRPRPRDGIRRGGRLLREVPPEVLDAVMTVARDCAATPYAVLTAAWAAVLGAWTGQGDLVIGCPTSGRSSARTAGVVGYFVNPVALRLDLSGNPRFGELVRRAQAEIVDAMDHQDYPFPELVARLGVAGDVSRNPVFQTMCVLYSGPGALFALGAPEAKLRCGEVVLESVAVDTAGAQVDLTLALAQDGGRSAMLLEYADVFEHTTAAGLADRLIEVLSALATMRDPTVARLVGAMGASRRAAVLAAASTPAPGPLPARCVHAWFEATAARAPEAIAVVDTAGGTTYGELNRMANRVAHRLRARGVGPEIRIGIHADRSVGTIATILGILKAGGAYVPVDPAHPAPRRAATMADAEVALLVGGQGLDLEALCAPGEPRLDRDPPSTTSAANAAYVIFTSGSSGRPKGVLVEHGGVCNLVRAQAKEFRVGPGATVLQYAALSFDASVSEIFVTLAAGGTLRLAEPLALLPGDDLARVLADGVTTVTLPPSVLEVLRAEELPDLATVVSAGEACPPEVVGRWAPGRLFLNAYGPTEATVCATMCRSTDRLSAARIGRAVPGAAAYVLGPELDLVPPGTVGEVYIGGLGVARGYVGAPELTAQRFVPDPFAPTPGARMYRTGDLARLRPDGALDFLRRADDQVNLRGYRIEPGEIEAVLRAHPRVRQAAVVPRVRGGHATLVAYLAVTGDPPATAELRDLTRRHLPSYMVPSSFAFLPDLPRTPSGKLDRAALPTPAWTRDDGELAAPKAEYELLVAQVWQEVLGLDRVGVDDNFFDLGGHSLHAVRVHSLLRERLGRELSLIELFEHATIRALGRHLARAGDGRGALDVAGIGERARRRAHALRDRRAHRGSNQ